MAQLVTLQELKIRARQASDMENSSFISDDELTTYLNQSLQKLYDLIVMAYGQEYYYAYKDIKITNSVQTYPLPDDFYKLIGVDLVLTSNPSPTSNRITLKPFMFKERNRYKNYYITTESIDGSLRLKYRLSGNNIVLEPAPTGNYSITVHYIPVLEKLEVDSDEFDGIQGWEEYAVLDTAIKMMRKEEGDTTNLRLDRADIEEKLISMARDRDAGSSERISDVAKDQAWLYYGYD